MTLAGKTVGRFRVLSMLGKGGMGEVHVAYDETLDRRVALKTILAGRRLNPAAQARFLREARVLSRLDHPNICRIYDYVESGEYDFLVLELVAGRSLEEAIREGVGADLQLRIAQQIASALVAAHAEGIVHRDLKPGNVMVSETGEVKVLDFGLAWTTGAKSTPTAIAAPATPPLQAGTAPTEAGFVGESDPTSDPTSEPTSEEAWFAAAELLPEPLPGGALGAPVPLAARGGEGVRTQHGVIVGTPAFMSPEQAHGEAATTASDMYTFGLLLQWLFTGRSPHPEDLPVRDLLLRAQRAESLPASGLHSDLAALVQRLKAAAPATRPTAVEVAARLRWIADAPKRRWRRLAAAAALALAVLGTTKYTLDLRAERALAVAAREEAERRRAQAEDLVQFMLGDLRERLEPVGRLDALDGVADKALDYFASAGTGPLGDSDLFRRSQALTQIGEVRIAQGDLAAAQRSLSEARTLSSGLVGRQPSNGDWLMGLGAIEFWLGNVSWLQGDLATAEEQFRAYLEVAERLVAIDGASPEWRMEKAYAHSNLGTVQNARGDVDSALGHFRLTVDVQRQMVRDAPADARWQRDLATSLSWLGEVLFGRGELAEARLQFEEGRAVLERLSAAAPDDTSYRFLLGIAHGKIGWTLECLGLLDEAVREYGFGLAIHRELAELDPANADWRREVAVGHRRLGVALVADDPAAALRHLRLAATTLAELHRADASNTERRLDFARARLDLGRGILRAGDPGRAAIEQRGALADLGPEAPGADDRPRRILEGEVHVALGEALGAVGRESEARSAREEAVAVLTPLASGSQDPLVLAPLVQALLGLGRRAEAQPLVDVLQAGGYRRAHLAAALR